MRSLKFWSTRSLIREMGSFSKSNKSKFKIASYKRKFSYGTHKTFQDPAITYLAKKLCVVRDEPVLRICSSQWTRPTGTQWTRPGANYTVFEFGWQFFFA